MRPDPVFLPPKTPLRSRTCKLRSGEFRLIMALPIPLQGMDLSVVDGLTLPAAEPWATQQKHDG
ncbi:MAG TPA: hypothetical protein DD856_16440 [Sulfobacillus sp.]|nr:hypothetical protein [Sulfobacillus sp.]